MAVDGCCERWASVVACHYTTTYLESVSLQGCMFPRQSNGEVTLAGSEMKNATKAKLTRNLDPTASLSLPGFQGREKSRWV